MPATRRDNERMMYPMNKVFCFLPSKPIFTLVSCLVLSLSLGAQSAWAMGKAPTESEKQATQQSTQVNSQSKAKNETSKQSAQQSKSPGTVAANTCERVLADFNKQQLKQQIDVAQLSEIVRSLDQDNRLPAYFITKRQAGELGWSPGTYFNSVPALRGKSIGGDRFGNFERRLPQGQWQEADLDYRGKKRNAKRLVFSRNGERYVTIDHYDSFKKVPPCQ